MAAEQLENILDAHEAMGCMEGLEYSSAAAWRGADNPNVPIVDFGFPSPQTHARVFRASSVLELSRPDLAVPTFAAREEVEEVCCFSCVGSGGSDGQDADDKRGSGSPLCCCC